VVKVTSLLNKLMLEVDQFWSQSLEILCIKSMFMLKVVSSEKNFGFKGV